MQMLGPFANPTESETPGVGLRFSKFSGGSDTHASLRTTTLSEDTEEPLRDAVCWLTDSKGGCDHVELKPEALESTLSWSHAQLLRGSSNVTLVQTT